MKLGSTSKWLLIYTFLLGALIFFNVLPCFKSGPCTPNFDFLSILIVSLTVIILLIRGVIMYFLKKEEGRIVLINIIAFAAWLCTMAMLSFIDSITT